MGINTALVHTWFILAVYYKIRHTLIQNATVILLQNATKIYYEMRQVFLLQSRTILLQNATVIRKFVDFITKYGSRYKMRRLLQNASLQGPRLAQTLKNRNLIA